MVRRKDDPTEALNNPALGRDWFPSPWGPDDQRGNANLLGPEKVLAAIRLVRDGLVVPLGFPYSDAMPLSPGRTFDLRMPGGPTGGPVGERSQAVWNDDFVVTEIGQIGTHMDALGHAGCACGQRSALFYNGKTIGEVWSPYGLKQLGIENAPIFFVRGILLDVQGFAGRPLDPGEAITADMLRECIAAQDMTDPLISPGEVVLIRTGHGSRFFSDAEHWYDGAPGIDLSAAEFLSAYRPSVVGADNFAVEVIPAAEPGLALPCHQHLIMRHGIYLHEGMNLDGLAEHRRHEFAYVFSPLPIVGATGSPGMPFAIL